MKKTIVVLPGDGIGPEIVAAAVEVLRAVEKKFGHEFAMEEYLIGGAAIDGAGDPLPAETLEASLAADGVLLGAVGGPKWDGLPGDARPEKGLLRIRKGLGLYANLRPATLFPALSAASPLRADIVAGGFDMLMFRELIGGVYFGEHSTEEADGEKKATDIMSYAEHEVERIAHMAFRAARNRRKKVTSVDKANVLDTSRLWRAVAERVAGEYPDVAFENMLVDNTAMQLVKNPAQFDVVFTENMFGDILSDEASMITGSIGMIPSASLGDERPDGSYLGMYEPIHGSAPDIAGQDKANPVGTILSAAMLLRYSCKMEVEAAAIEVAVNRAIEEGVRTGDIARPGEVTVGCAEMGRHVASLV